MSLCSDKGGGFRGSRRRLMYFSFRNRRENCSGTTSPVAFVESFCSCAPQQVRAFHFNVYKKRCDLLHYNCLSSFSPLHCFLFYARLTSSSKFAYLLCVSDFCLKLIMTLLLFSFFILLPFAWFICVLHLLALREVGTKAESNFLSKFALVTLISTRRFFPRRTSKQKKAQVRDARLTSSSKFAYLLCVSDLWKS